MSKAPSQKIQLYFDGACEPKNPGGYGTYGFVVRIEGNLIKKGRGYIGQGKGITNNVAEYTALIRGLEYLKNNYSSQSMQIHGDSQLIIRQMKGEYAVRSDRLKSLWKKAKSLTKSFDIEFKWIPREKNEEADRLTKEEYKRVRSRRSDQMDANKSIFYVLPNNHLALGVGKYADKQLETVAQNDPDYLKWFLKQDIQDKDKEYIRAAIEKDYVKKRKSND